MPASAAQDDYDSPWKEAVEHAFPEFIDFYFPDAGRQIDWARGHRFLDKELQQIVRDAALGRRQALPHRLVALARGAHRGVDVLGAAALQFVKGLAVGRVDHGNRLARGAGAGGIADEVQLHGSILTRSARAGPRAGCGNMRGRLPRHPENPR